MSTINSKLLFIAMLALLFTCGCSTLLSQHEQTGQASLFVDPEVLCAQYPSRGGGFFPLYYGGVTFDAYTIFIAPFADNANLYNQLVKYYYPAALLYSLVDLPFSFVADTIAFPYNFYVLSRSEKRHDKAGNIFYTWPHDTAASDRRKQPQIGIQSVSSKGQNGRTTFTIKGSKGFERFASLSLSDPPRFILDIANSDPGILYKETAAAVDPVVRISARKIGYTTRIEFLLSREVHASAMNYSGDLVIRFVQPTEATRTNRP